MKIKKSNYLRLRVIDCLCEIKLSFFPCKRKVGDLTFFIFSRLLKRSLTMYLKNHAKSSTIPLIEVNALIKTSAPT